MLVYFTSYSVLFMCMLCKSDCVPCFQLSFLSIALCVIFATVEDAACGVGYCTLLDAPVVTVVEEVIVEEVVLLETV